MAQGLLSLISRDPHRHHTHRLWASPGDTQTRRRTSWLRVTSEAGNPPCNWRYVQTSCVAYPAPHPQTHWLD